MATDAKENPDEKIMWHDRSLTDLQIKFPVMLKWLSASSYFLERFLSIYILSNCVVHSAQCESLSH